jgi:aldehyde dehydrogenase (NAD+)
MHRCAIARCGWLRLPEREHGIPVIAEERLAECVPPTGHFVKPTLFGPVPRDAALAREEVFGPVLAAMPFDDAVDGVELPFGGTKRSGHGREKGLPALEEMSTTNTLVHYHG